MTKSAETAVHKLELSKLDPKSIQQELMGDDLDLEKLVVYLKSQIKFDAAEQVIDVQIQRSIDQSSTVVVSLHDYERSILNSGLLNSRLDIQIDGLWFRLVKVSRNAGSSQLDLTFEDREIALLRSYPKKGVAHNGLKFAHRSKTTRAEFILNLIREVKEVHIPVVIPELHKVLPIQKTTDAPASTPVSGQGGIPYQVNRVTEAHLNPRMNIPGVAAQYFLTVKGVPATKEQIANANTIIAVGQQMGVPRKLLVCAIMTATTESTLHNLSGGDAAHGGGKQDSAGLFQQYAPWGSYRDRTDPATSSRMFYNAAIKVYNEEPNAPLWQICADTQRPRADLRKVYDLWHVEADRTVTTYGGTADVAGANLMNPAAFGSTAADYIFYRGIPTFRGKIWKREDSWTCIKRLANEVNWRAFMVSGVFYLITDQDLIKMQPIMIIDETSPGVEGIGFDYDIGKKMATVSINAHVGRWLAPPGAVVALQHMGPVNGRWLVNDFSRSLFNPSAQINCSKQQPLLPEPATEAIQAANIPTWASGSGKTTVTDPTVDTSSGPLASAASNAEKLLHDPHWHDDNGQGRGQLMKVALGSQLFGAVGPVNLDPRVPGVILWLIQKGYRIGTYAWCTDHSNDGLHGHAGGFAVDISSINGISINTDSLQARSLVLEVGTLLHNLQGPLHPRQLITGGYGNHADLQIAENTIPNPGYYGATTMSEHCNHIHVGY